MTTTLSCVESYRTDRFFGSFAVELVKFDATPLGQSVTIAYGGRMNASTTPCPSAAVQTSDRAHDSDLAKNDPQTGLLLPHHQKRSGLLWTIGHFRSYHRPTSRRRKKTRVQSTHQVWPTMLNCSLTFPCTLAPMVPTAPMPMAPMAPTAPTAPTICLPRYLSSSFLPLR